MPLPYIYDKAVKLRFIATKLMEENTEELALRNKEMESLINAIPSPILIKRQETILFQNKKMDNLMQEIERKIKLKCTKTP